ncbi:MAG: hypothetical protein QM658_10265 [Gordonia sp. (in: high G+C Gram-positive bacteria)]
MRIARLATVLGGVAVVAAALAGCSSDEKAAAGSTTTAASSIESSKTESSTTESSKTGAPAVSEVPETADVPAPANALTMKCSEFLTLDEAAQTAVAAKIIEGDRTNINPNNKTLAATIAKSLCTHYPDRTVDSILGAKS